LVPTSSLPLRLFLSSFHLNIFCFSQILSRSRVVKISAGETFFGPTRRDKYIYELLAGRCLSESTESAGQSPFSCQSGDVIGETSLITGLPPSYSVKTRGPCRLLQISKKLLLASGRSDDVSFQILAVIFEGTLIRACLFERALSKYLNSPPQTSPSSDRKLRAVGSGTFLEFSDASFQHTLTRSSTSSMVHSSLTMDISRDESESSQCDSVSSDVQFRADETSVVEAQAFGFYRPRLLDWHRFTDEHLSYLLISGTSHEINILALLHPYMFPSPQVMLTKVLELSSTSSPKRFVRLVASILRFNWHYLQAVEIADQLKMLVHRAQSISVADDAPLKDAFALETAQTQLEHAHTFAQERLRDSASSLIAASPRRCSFEDMPPQQVALALSFLDSEQVSNIHPTELMRKRFTDRISAPRLHSTIDHFNEMTKWIMSMVINPTERSQRAWQISRWVQIGTALLVESNFSSLQIVMTALDHVNVTRLKATWELVPHDVQKEFQRLCQVVTPLKNFENYRTLLAQNIKSAIPIIPTITKDLFQIEEVHETFEKHRHLNMRKLHRIYEIMHNFICIQTSIREAYASRVPDPAYLRFLQQKDGLIDSADVLYELSIKREPNSVPAKKLVIREPPSNQSSNDVFNISPTPSRDASIRARFTRKGATVGRIASANMSPSTLSDSGSHHILRIKILGTTPAFMNLGLHSVTKTLVLTSRQTDSVMVVSLLIEKLVSTMRPSQSQLFIKEALEYVLYEEKNGKTIPVPDKPLSTRPDLLLTFELDRTKPKMSPDAFKMLKLEYENAMLSEELQSAQDHIAKLELQLALLDPDPVDI
ncbi:MAG: RasGEF domain-containing protein, partial [archaeon]|nr:RasGEF domain-containing protein [archaeon]